MSRPTVHDLPIRGWKAIAAHLEVSERTALRLYATGGLPVKRDAFRKPYTMPQWVEDWKAERERAFNAPELADDVAT